MNPTLKLIIALLPICAILGIAGDKALAANSVHLSPSIEKLLSLPEDQIDIGTAGLIFAKDIYPQTDIELYSKRIDEAAAEVQTLKANAQRQHLSGLPDEPDNTILAINEVFYNRKGYKYDHSADAMGNALNFFLPGVIERKLGICSTLPMLYMAIAQRAGLPLYAVETTQHNFLRTNDPRSKIGNIEVTSGGSVQDQHYIDSERLSQISLKRGTYLRTMTHHEYLAMMLNINAAWYEGNGQTEKAIQYYLRSIEINPHSPDATLALMVINFRKAVKAQSDLIFLPQGQEGLRAQSNNYFDQALHYRKRLSEMGVRLEAYQTQPEITADPNAKTQ